MKKQIFLAVTAVALLASLNISQAEEKVEISPAQTYANQVMAQQDQNRIAEVIATGQAKLAICQQQESADCSYYEEILSLLEASVSSTSGAQ